MNIAAEEQPPKVHNEVSTASPLFKPNTSIGLLFPFLHRYCGKAVPDFSGPRDPQRMHRSFKPFNSSILAPVHVVQLQYVINLPVSFNFLLNTSCQKWGGKGKD
jgi:hypothetical protein